MSITVPTVVSLIRPPVSATFSDRILKDVLQMMSEPKLRARIVLTRFYDRSLDIAFMLGQSKYSKFDNVLTVKFQEYYPLSAPLLQMKKSDFGQSLEKMQTIESWSAESQLKDVIIQVVSKFTKYFDSHLNQLSNYTKFDNNQLSRGRQSEQENTKKRVLMNGCADNELTETKNLNRHFRSKLREVYFDVTKDGLVPPQNAQWIQHSFTLPRVGFDDIAKVLKNEWFNIQINKQMQNGKFMHKIMKGMMSIKSKKLMVKYYHVMLAAAKDPDNFVKWKYQ